jgi:GTP cyclohydrolase II
MEVASFTPALDGDLVVHVGDPLERKSPLVRIHSACVFSEVFGSDFCDCAEQLELAMEALTHEGAGLLFYLRFEARGAGLAAKVKATALEIRGVDTFESRIAVGVSPESRDFAPVGRYLFEKGFKNIRLLTNNPLKVAHLEGTGVHVLRQPLLSSDPNENVKALYRTKAAKFSHWLPNV